MRRLLVAGVVTCLFLSGSGHADPPPVTVGSAQLTLAAGSEGLAVLPVRLGPAQGHVDVEVLLDVSGSMARQLPRVESAIAETLTGLAARGTDVRAGLAIAGTSPSTGSGDPLVDPDNPSYAPPVPFRRLLPVGPLATFLPALRAVRTETYPTTDAFDFQANGRLQGQLFALHQLLTGSGYPGTTGRGFRDAVPAGQVAGWRSDPTVDRVLVDVTDQTFDTPGGTPAKAQVAQELEQQRVRHVGAVTYGFAAAVSDLEELSRVSGAVATRSLACSGLTGDKAVAPGTPLTCSTQAVGRALADAVTGVMALARPALQVTADPTVRSAALSLLGPLTTGAVHADAAVLRVGCPVAATAVRHQVRVTISWLGRQAVGQLTLFCTAASTEELVLPGRAPLNSTGSPAGAGPGSGTAGVPGPGPGPAPPASTVGQGAFAPQPGLNAGQQRQQQEALAGEVLLLGVTLLSFALLVARRRQTQLSSSTRPVRR